MKILVCLLLFVGWSTLVAQEIQLSGVVVNKKNRPIEQVNVYLEGSFDGALTDAQGYFSFIVEDSLVDGVLKLKHPHYASLEVPIYTNHNYEQQFVLKEEEELLGEIVIKTTRKDKRGAVDRIAFTAMDVVSTAGSPGNIIGALTTLPGAQTNGEDGRLLIRGGKAEESGIYVNGMKVFQPYTAAVGQVPVRSKFNPFLFKGMSFSAGGYSAEYGDALSGILELDTSDAIDPSRKEGSLSTVGASLGQTHQWKKNSVSYTVNYLNLEAYTRVVKQRYKTKKPFTTASAEVVYKREIQEGGYKLYAAVDYAAMAYEQQMKPSNRVDTLAFSSNTLYVNSAYFKKLSPFMRLDVGTGLGYSWYKGDHNESRLNQTNWDLNQKVKGTYQWNAHLQTVWGIDFHLSQVAITREKVQQTASFNPHAFQTALFLENQWKISEALQLRAGVRTSQYTAISKWVVEPRMLLNYQFNAKQQIAFSYGVFHQALSVEQALPFKQEDWMRAKHYILNYTYTLRKRMLRAELFYKDYTGLLLTPLAKNESFSQQGKGNAKGVDLFWSDNTSIQNFNYWITYTYLDAKRKESYWAESIQPTYVAKHHLAVVTKYWIATWKSQVSMTYNYSSPRSFYALEEPVQAPYKSSPIHNVSLSWAYVIQTQKILYVSVDNLLGRNPIQAYQFNQSAQQPDGIQPTAKRFVYVGLMWTISSDKKSNQLENL